MLQPLPTAPLVVHMTVGQYLVAQCKELLWEPCVASVDDSAILDSLALLPVLSQQGVLSLLLLLLSHQVNCQANHFPLAGHATTIQCVSLTD
jgi:hypothetical protein